MHQPRKRGPRERPSKIPQPSIQYKLDLINPRSNTSSGLAQHPKTIGRKRVNSSNCSACVPRREFTNHSGSTRLTSISENSHNGIFLLRSEGRRRHSNSFSALAFTVV